MTAALLVPAGPCTGICCLPGTCAAVVVGSGCVFILIAVMWACLRGYK